MTQIPPAFDVNPVVTGPVTLTVGVDASIAYPTQAPQLMGWVVVTNSSPFTLAVKQTGGLGLLAAFTADVFPVRSQEPITLHPFAGAGLTAPGTDTSAYGTWYRDLPPGQYPAALGAGAIPIAQSSTLAASAPSRPIASLGTDAWPPIAPASTQGWGAVTMFIAETSGLGPLTVTISWFDSGGIGLGGRQVIVPAGGVARVSVPHEGAMVQITVFNNTAVGLTYTLHSAQSTFPVAQWNTVTGVLIGPTTTVVGAGLSVVIGTASSLFAGPAQLIIQPNASAAWSVTPQLQDGTGAWSGASVTITNTTFAPQIPLLLPPQPVRLLWTNNDGVARTPICSLFPDDYRHAA